MGFRPFIYQLAHRHSLSGYVSNTPQGVELEIQGREGDVHSFFDAVKSDHPPLAHIVSVEWREIPLKPDGGGFEIRTSQRGQERFTLISPDVSICSDCQAELKNPHDRRYRYPFINCTNCGPRYTIIMNIPYDRATTTMNRFVMCPECQREYDDPINRRFHAQPNACPRCGPKVWITDAQGNTHACQDPVQEAVSLLTAGNILAIKGLGGFHLAVDAANHGAVTRLRKRKHREEKPLALMVRDLAMAREIAHVNEVEAKTLCSHQRPIVIVRKRRTHALSPQVAPRNKNFGIMLPYTPLHILLMGGPFRALVMTSGNMTEEPINIDNEEALKNLGDIADYFLVHDRDIYLRSDDSIVRVIDQVPRQIRRSRGYVPVPVFLSQALKDLPPVMAVGGEIKNTVCLTKENLAFLSQHVGDMENLETLQFFHLTLSHLKTILEIRPQVLAHDLHPDYLSSKYAWEQQELPTVGVQHHHAHIVSCLAEHGLRGPVIGVAMDGTGLGTDGQIWGGEILLADLVSFKRAAHLKYVPLPGGDAAARFPWRMALMYLHRAYQESLFDLPIPFVRSLEPHQARLVLQMAEKGVNSPLTSSCGRFFDAVSSLLGLRHTIAYEGQAAVELEMCQHRTEKGGYGWRRRSGDDCWVVETEEIVRGIVKDIIKGESKGVISRRFHNTLIRMFTDLCALVKDESGVDDIAFSGGAFQNKTLLTGLSRSLIARGFRVYSHAQVPTNDGSLALGQAVCAGLRYKGAKGAYP